MLIFFTRYWYKKSPYYRRLSSYLFMLLKINPKD
uniref:Uncharacterized protein n=1 Tax=Siphoviridae sp. ctAFE3 TaxID=2827796 RepID=A0A8S5S718_9CAUD|nr:MAG TPA: hypothetical protein [Siphoviridae sp. ctAFE3]